jgi:hypothetical protein
MAKQLSLLFALVLASGCAASHERACGGSGASVTIEETGEVLGADVNFQLLSRDSERSDFVAISLERGWRMDVVFPQRTVVGSQAFSLGAEAPDAEIALSGRSRGCSPSAMSEGELIVDYVHRSSGIADCLIGSLRVRFADCDAEVFGRPASETTFLVEFGR